MASQSPDPVTLVVGADSLIGSALVGHLRDAGQGVIGTTRRREAVDASTLYLDLSGDVASWTCPLPISVAYLCAGVTGLESCRREPVPTARVNIDGISTLAQNLVAHGAFVVYLSTNQVFDGTKPHRSPDDPVSPVTEYGRQKAEAERRISRWGDSASIVRLTKVLYPAAPLLYQWREALERGDTVEPFSDMYMAPVPLDHVVTVLRLVGEQCLPGILQVSGDRDISYAEAALMGARMIGADAQLVRPVRTLDANVLMQETRFSCFPFCMKRRRTATFGAAADDAEFSQVVVDLGQCEPAAIGGEFTNASAEQAAEEHGCRDVQYAFAERARVLRGLQRDLCRSRAEHRSTSSHDASSQWTGELCRCRSGQCDLSELPCFGPAGHLGSHNQSTGRFDLSTDRNQNERIQNSRYEHGCKAEDAGVC